MKICNEYELVAAVLFVSNASSTDIWDIDIPIS
jgi:hypothetical protein